MSHDLDPLREIPEPLVIHRRLGQLEREKTILSKLLILSLRANEEVAEREDDLRDCEGLLRQHCQSS